MVSTTSRGNYYKGRTKKFYEALGYQVQITEFMTTLVFGDKKIFKKIDIFGSDMIAMNGDEILFINSKHFTDPKSRKDQIYQGKKEFEKYQFPQQVKRILVMWEPKKKPEIIECSLSTEKI